MAIYIYIRFGVKLFKIKKELCIELHVIIYLDPWRLSNFKRKTLSVILVSHSDYLKLWPT